MEVSAPPNFPVGQRSGFIRASADSGCPDKRDAGTNRRHRWKHLKNSRSSSRSYTIAMKRTFASTAVLILVLATISLAQTAPTAGAAPATTAPTAATTTGGVKVGIIDIQQAIVGTNEGARDFEALQKKFEPKRNELAGLN